MVEGDEVAGFQALSRNITDRKRAEQEAEREREQLRRIVAHAPVAMAMLDRERRYIAHSTTWLKYAGYDYRFEYGDGGHNGKHGGAILPDSLRWLWRDHPEQSAAKGE